MSKRVFLIVLDSAGIGEAPDADKFDDVGCDTFGTCVRSGKLNVPNMKKLGLFNIDNTSFTKKQADVIGCYAKMQEKSAGKDTTVGHWEIAGYIKKPGFKLFPNGFPKEVLDELKEKANLKGILSNENGSGTEQIHSEIFKDSGIYRM